MAHPPASREAAFTRLYEAHYDTVHAYAYRRDPAHVDDIVAETFLVAWRRLDEVPADVLPWLLGVARNARLNIRRGESRRLGLHSRVAAAEPAWRRHRPRRRRGGGESARPRGARPAVRARPRGADARGLGGLRPRADRPRRGLVARRRGRAAPPGTTPVARLLASYETPAGDRPAVTGGLTDAS